MNSRIEMIRKHENLTRANFGKKLGVSGDVVNNLERGRVEIKDHMIKLICKVFNVNEEWLREGTGEMFIELDEEDQLMLWAGKVFAENDSFKKRFVKMLMSLDVEEWEIIERRAFELVANRTKDSE